MAVTCRFPETGGAYERTVTGWVDTRGESQLAFSARLADGRADLEVALVAEPSPSYLVSEATATARSETTRRACEGLLEAVGQLRGVRIVGGFRRQVAGLVGEHPFAPYVVDAAIEAARLSRQVTRMDVPADARPDPAGFHRLDLEAWPELRDLCFTYRPESAALFADRSVRTPAVLDMYAAGPGQSLVFHRYKRSRVARSGATLSLYQSMFDQVHGFELWYDVDERSGRVVDARVLTPRLPYLGICDEPQRRVRDMVGAELDAGWADLVRARLGGRQGCFQLTDLTTDLFRLLAVG